LFPYVIVCSFLFSYLKSRKCVPTCTVEQVEQYIKDWDGLKEAVCEEHWENVAGRLREQLRSAKDWRDFLNTYYHRFSGADDEKNRRIFR
jgi:alpha-glucuronidase